MKSKKILTILLSLAIMFTFMPAMAFAGSSITTTVKSWSDKMATVTDDKGNTFNTTRDFQSSSAMIKTDGNDDDPVVGIDAPNQSVYFYDFDSSKLVYGGTAGAFTGTTANARGKTLDGTTWSDFSTLATLTVEMAEASYDQYADAANANKQFFNIALTKSLTANDDGSVDWVGYTGNAGATNGLYKVVAKQSKYDTAKKFEDQTVTFDVTITANKEFTVDGSTTGPDMFGKTASATITVKAAKKGVSDAKITVDGVGTGVKAIGTDSLTGQYDGAAHKVVAEEIEGYTVSWKILNRSNNKYEDAPNGVSITDVAEAGKAIKFKVIYTDNATKVPEEGTHEINLTGASATGFGFVDGTRAATGGAVESVPNYYVVGTSYDAESYVEFVPTKRTNKDDAYLALTTDEDKAAYLAVGAAYESAASANSAALLEAFKAYYDVKATVDKYNTNLVTLTFDAKDLKSAEKKALDEKYAQLFRNFSQTAITGLVNTARNSAAVILNSDLIDTEVEFTSAPTVKTYKGSKTTKKGKLKKTQSFTVKAVCNNGAAVTYKVSVK